MRTHIARFGVIMLGLLVITYDADGRGFGGFRGGSFGGGGFDRSSFGGFDRSASGWGGYHTNDFSSYRSGGAAFGSRGAAVGGSYDRTFDGAHGGSYSASGTRGAVRTPWGGAAGHTRDVTATGPEGRTYSSDRTSFSRFATDGGFAHYSSGAITGVRGGTAYWSHGSVATRAGYVRGGFVHYNSFHGAWWTGHPNAWRPAAWGVAGATYAAWVAASWATIALACAIPEPPIYYDYGNTIVYQNNNVYVNGSDVGTTEQYSQQASAIAAQGQAANPPPTAQWQSLGVFSLVQGDEQSSNTMFQIAVDTNGTIRGNYYDALMDTTTPIYGSVDKKTQRAAWYIGDKKSTVFETGFYNLTKDQTPVLVHFGKDRTQQWLLVHMKQPDSAPKP